MSKFDGGVLGKSRMDGICSDSFSGGFSAGFESGVEFMSVIVAHELGHNLGISHDAKECYCQKSTCIMTNKGSNLVLPYEWSSCSIYQARNASEQGLYRCLK